MFLNVSGHKRRASSVSCALLSGVETSLNRPCKKKTANGEKRKHNAIARRDIAFVTAVVVLSQKNVKMQETFRTKGNQSTSAFMIRKLDCSQELTDVVYSCQ